MVVGKEESYLETKHKFKNQITSPTEFQFCEQPHSSLISIEIVCETVAKKKKKKFQIRSSASFLPWMPSLFIFTSVNMKFNEFQLQPPQVF